MLCQMDLMLKLSGWKFYFFFHIYTRFTKSPKVELPCSKKSCECLFELLEDRIWLGIIFSEILKSLNPVDRKQWDKNKQDTIHKSTRVSRSNLQERLIDVPLNMTQRSIISASVSSSSLDSYPYVSSLVCAFFMCLTPLWIVISSKHPASRTLLYSGWEPVITAMVISRCVCVCVCLVLKGERTAILCLSLPVSGLFDDSSSKQIAAH